jgi:hypothetical protein
MPQSINDPAHDDVIDRTADHLQDAYNDVSGAVGHAVDDAVARIEVSRKALAAWGRQLVKQGATEGYTAAIDKIHHETQLRQQAEDIRANHRNFNRMMTMFGALVIGLVVTFLLTHPTLFQMFGLTPGQVKPFAPYAFTITILLDSAITMYSYIRHY